MSQITDTIKANTAIVLVPGSFSSIEVYVHVARTLRNNGFKSVHETPLLSSCPPDDQRKPPAKLEDDSFYIREVLHALLLKGKDIIMVMNSYGGFPGTQALQGLPSRGSLTNEAKEGQQGAVVGLVYLSSFLPLPGDSLRTVMDEYLFEPLKTGDSGKYMYMPDGAGAGIFSDWAAEGESRDEDIKYWSDKITTHSSDSFDGKVSYDLWADGNFKGKVVYVIGEKDVIVPPALAESMIEKVQTQAGKDKVEVKRFETGGHVMQVTKPDLVVQTIEELLGRLAK